MITFGRLIRHLGNCGKAMNDYNFWKGKTVFVTGHTGFKGSWLCRILNNLGANVVGYSLAANTDPSLYEMLPTFKVNNNHSIIGDIRDFPFLKESFDNAKPDVVLHLAAQPIVTESYKNPHYTYETNVMGTVNLLECVRLANFPIMSVLNVTTDKVYLNNETNDAFGEDLPLDGYDPYSNSKSCSELVTHSYKNSFFNDMKIPVSTARAGNVIGGGDFALDRIIPDCVRAMRDNKTIEVRNPYSTRPYQHVLEPLFAYLMIAEKQVEDLNLSGYYNVGPDECDCVTTGELVDIFCKKWGDNASWENKALKNAPHEASFLKLDCTKLKKTFTWQPHWHIDKAVDMTCRWSKQWLKDGNITEEIDREIKEYTEKKTI